MTERYTGHIAKIVRELGTNRDTMKVSRGYFYGVTSKHSKIECTENCTFAKTTHDRFLRYDGGTDALCFVIEKNGNIRKVNVLNDLYYNFIKPKDGLSKWLGCHMLGINHDWQFCDAQTWFNNKGIDCLTQDLEDKNLSNSDYLRIKEFFERDVFDLSPFVITTCHGIDIF